MPEFRYQNQTIPYEIRQSARARRMRLQINGKGLQVILPRGIKVDDKMLEQILQERGAWILKTLQRLTPPTRQFAQGEPILYLGETYPLNLYFNPERKRIKIIGVAKGEFRIEMGSDEVTYAGLERALKRWYIQQAKTYLPERLAQIAQQYGFAYQTVRVREQKSQWGSCSHTGNLSLNARLIMAPPAAIDYVIIHELCHLKEMNHSPRFWAWVAHYCPDYKAIKRWFKQAGHSLQF